MRSPSRSGKNRDYTGLVAAIHVFAYFGIVDYSSTERTRSWPRQESDFTVKKTRLVIGVLVASAIVTTPAVALASHFRSSYTSTVVTGDSIAWTLETAWRSDDIDDIGDAQYFSVDTPGAAPGQGTELGEASMSDPVYDTSDSLFAATTEVATYDFSALADGQYDLYTEDCCRVEDVVNTDGEDDFSQWHRFTKTGSTYNLAPAFNSPTLYKIIEAAGETTADFSATDPEGGAVTYTHITDISGPFYGGADIACSSLSGGLLTISPALCTGSDVFSEIYTPGSYWTYKVQAADAEGNFATVDTLFRVITPPEPEIDDANPVRSGNAYEFVVYAPDTAVTSFTVTCTNVDDVTEVRSATAGASPVTVEGLRPGASYECDVAAVNSAGTGENDQNYSIGPVALDGLDLTLDLAPGMEISGAQTVLSGGNLQPNSEFTLERRSTPIVVYTGTTDPQGNFYELVNLPAEACAYGIHELVLTGINTQGQTVSDTVWLEMDSSCVAVQISRQEIFPSLPEQALPNTGLTTIGIVVGVMFAGAFFVFASGSFAAQGALEFAGSRQRLVHLIRVTDATLRRTERYRR